METGFAPLHVRDLDALLRRHKSRATRQRRAVYAALAARHDHPTAEALHRDVRRRLPDLSLATVYKTLELLVRAGAAAKAAHGDGVAHYDARAEAHDHLRCLGCGRVRDLDLPRRSERISDVAVASFLVTGFNLEVVGYCASCAPPAPASVPVTGDNA